MSAPQGFAGSDAIVHRSFFATKPAGCFPSHYAVFFPTAFVGGDSYIKPADYEVRKTRKFRNDRFRVENMPYDAETDSFTCPNGKKLVHLYDSHRKSENGFAATKQNYICESCADCPYHEKCYKGTVREPEDIALPDLCQTETGSGGADQYP